MNIQSKKGYTALLCTRGWYSHESLKMLITAGADVNICAHGGYSIIRKVLETTESLRRVYAAGAHVNMVDINIKTAEYNSQRSEILKLLFAAGENIDGAGKVARKVKKELNQDLELNLIHLCRAAIRKHLLQTNSVNLLYRVPRLGLPKLLQKFMLYNISLEDDNDA